MLSLLGLSVMASAPCAANATQRPLLILETALAVGAGFDSNPLRLSPEQGPQGAPVLRMIPSLRIETMRSKTLAFLLVAQGEVISPVGTLETSAASEFSGELRLGLWPRGPLTITFSERLNRTAYSPDVSFVDPLATLSNRVGLDLATRTAFPLYAGAGYSYEVIGSARNSANHDRHTFSSFLGWEFARHAHLSISAIYMLLRWEREDEREVRLDHEPLTLTIAIDGHAGQSWWGRLAAGYSDASGPGVKHLVGVMEMGWERPTGGATIGFERRVQPSFYGRYYATWSGYAGGHFTAGPAGRGRTHFDIHGSFGLAVFGPFQPTRDTDFASHEVRTGQLISGAMRLEVEALPWLRIGVHYEADVVVSNFRWQRVRPTTDGFETDILVWHYQRHTAWLSMSVIFDSTQ